MKVVKAYRFALDPRPDQVTAFLSHCGGRRFAYNHMLGLVKANLDQRRAERSYGIAEAALTPVLDWSAYRLRKAWNTRKEQVAPWWAANSKEAYASGCADLAAALENWRASKLGSRKGKPVGFPRPKLRRSRLSCSFTTGAIRAEADRRHITLPRIGTIRTFENTAKLHRHLLRGTGRILSATLAMERSGRWFVSFTCEIEHRERTPEQPEAVVGIDLGVKHLAVLSTGEFVPNPRRLEAAQQRLRRANRVLARREGPAPGKAPSHRWQKARQRISRLHRKVAAQRGDAVHKLTGRLARSYGTIVVEDLHVAGMLRNRPLARRIADASLGEIRRRLEYKTAWNGGVLVTADRWSPTSKTCSSCGAVKTKLRLSERTFACEQCGAVIDRDLNAALNLRNLAQKTAVDLESPGHVKTARRKPRKTGPAGSGIAAGRPAADAGQSS
ncbi:IS607 family element RNA-guided endonuclease TnpB [Glycomyces sp. MUSA5-2]|uniref:IS607 family element RNA-guided endonuclease TnpB n=1 Tax=Glycomyces sp. MUSA5-2 TaxID=2053002 RepID=UPI0030090FDC